MSLFRKRRSTASELAPEDRFEMVYDLVKPLPKADFNKLIDGVKLAWEGYDKALRIQTRDDKKDKDIKEPERELEYEETEAK